MVLLAKSIHPKGDSLSPAKNGFPDTISVATYDGKVHIEWDSDAPVTPMGQLPFFIQFLKLGGRFDPWIEDFPLNLL